MYKGEKPLEAGLAPGWTLDELAMHAVDFWLSTEDLPNAENRITVDGQGTITLSYRPANQVPKQKLYEKLKSMLSSLDMPDASRENRTLDETEPPSRGYIIYREEKKNHPAWSAWRNPN